MDIDEANTILKADHMQKLTQICVDTLSLVQEQPTRDDLKTLAENAALKAVNAHRESCPAMKQFPSIIEKTTDSTTRIKLMSGIKRSIAPNKGDPQWVRMAKILVPPIATAILGALGYSVI